MRPAFELEAQMEAGITVQRYVGSGVSHEARLMLSPDRRSIVCVRTTSKKASDSAVRTIRRAMSAAQSATSSANANAISTQSKVVAFLVDVTELTKGQAGKVHGMAASEVYALALAARSLIRWRVVGLHRLHQHRGGAVVVLDRVRLLAHARCRAAERGRVGPVVQWLGAPGAHRQGRGS